MSEFRTFSGKTVDEATTVLQNAGFEVGTTSTKYDDSVEAGKVISQDPAAEAKREKGTKVNLVVSQGTEQVSVPDLTGMSADEAKQALKEKGLVPVGGEAKYSDTVAQNRVMGQSPAAGSTVAKGASIEYYLSLGTESISVPDVVGKGEAAARASLQNAGFDVTVDYSYSDSVAEGNVISQSPNANSKLGKGETVSITVSNGKQPASSFTVSASTIGDGGYVSPSSMTVDKGSSVTFTVSVNTGYTVSSVTDTNGKTYSVSASGGTFTVSNVTSDVAVTVTFKQETTSNQTDVTS